jgi:nitrogenase-associated protein
MPHIVFYEKPGCANNTRQKALLAMAGHEVVARNLLTEPWTAGRLLEFFGQRPVAEWFNRAAPRVKSGEIIPESLNTETALGVMLQDPLLIRRPLIEANGRKEAGFDQALIQRWIGLTPSTSDLESCPRSHEHTSCPVLPEAAH